MTDVDKNIQRQKRSVTNPSPPPSVNTPAKRFSLDRLHGSWSRVLIIILVSLGVGLYFQARTGVFFSSGNFTSILLFMSTVAIIGFGSTLVLVTGELDLSIGAVYGMCSMMTGLLWLAGWPFWLSALIGVGAGALAGLINGLLVTKLGISSFITTLGTLNLFMGVSLLISHNTAVGSDPGLSDYWFYDFVGNARPLGIPIQIYWLVIAFAVMWVVLQRSIFGFHAYAVGGNETAAKSAHLPITRVKVIAFVVSGTLAAAAGVIDYSLVSAVSPTAGSSLMFTVLAAVVIGGASLSGGQGTIIGALAGAFLLQVLTNGLGLLGAGVYLQMMFQGGIILLAIALDRWAYRSRPAQVAM